jgi:hypothetical protein
MRDNSGQRGRNITDRCRQSRRGVLQTVAAASLVSTVGTGLGTARTDDLIEYGATVTGTTEDSWQFEAAVDDEVSIDVRLDDPVNEDAEITLFDPSGEEVERVERNAEDGNAAITQYYIERRQGGTYTVDVATVGENPTGYTLSLYEGVPTDDTISYGDTVESQLTRDNRYFSDSDFGGYHETYSFAATEGDRVSIEIRPDDPIDIEAQITLLDPDGNEVDTVVGTGEDGNAVLTFYYVERGQGGQYTIVATGEDYTNLFGYTLSLYEGIPVDNAILYGETIESELTRADRYFGGAEFSGYHETYAFEAAEGDSVSVEVEPDDPVENTAQITLFDPDGEEVDQADGNAEDGNAALTRYTIRRGQGGQYTIVITGEDYTDLFGYSVSLYEGIPVDDTISYGETIESELTRADRYFDEAEFGGYHETYAFEASAGDEVTVTAEPADPVENAAQITLFDPAGAEVDEAEGGGDGIAVIDGYRIADGQGGTYRAVVSGEDRSELFAYTVGLTLDNRAEQSETPTETDTPTETATPTETPTATPTASPTATPTATETQPISKTSTATQTTASADTTSSSSPGLGIGTAVAGVAGVVGVLKRIVETEIDDS